MLDTQLEEMAACRSWRLWPVLDRQMVEIVACTGQIW